MFAALSCYRYLELRLRVALAQEQVRVFASMAEEARAGGIVHAVECLEYTAAYYPTGTKQTDSSQLGEIVELSRKIAIRDIIATLRRESGNDFGADPAAWISNRDTLGRPRAGSR